MLNVMLSQLLETPLNGFIPEIKCMYRLYS